MSPSQFAHRLSFGVIVFLVTAILAIPLAIAGAGGALVGFFYGDKFWEKVFEAFPDFPKF